ncbi:MAG: hypothetical protein K6A44_02805 [bacterium]|nr:hypothetical protein [bacterium]
MQNLPAYLRPSAFLGGVIGLVLGFLLAIPIIQLFVVFVFFGIGAITVFMLKQNHFMDSFEQKDGIIIGGVSGFVSIITATVSFLVLALLLGSIFAGTYDMIMAFFGSFSAFVVLCILIFCVAFMNMIFNMGSALLVVSLYGNVEKKEDKPQFKV